ncbi:MAG: hypothetical protein AB1467_06695 [Candidatus Diapherotrites archaeon]
MPVKLYYKKCFLCNNKKTLKILDFKNGKHLYLCKECLNKNKNKKLIELFDKHGKKNNNKLIVTVWWTAS